MGKCTIRLIFEPGEPLILTDIQRPKLFKVQIQLGPVNPSVSNGPRPPPGATRSLQSSNVAGTPTASITASQPIVSVSFLTASRGSNARRIDRLMCPQLFGDRQPIRILVDHDDQGRRVERGGHERREPDGHRAAGLDFPVENAAFQPRGYVGCRGG